MNGEKLVVFPDPPHERPELEFILSGCTTDDERKAIAQAFHTFAQGDPGGFSVQFRLTAPGGELRVLGNTVA